MEHMFIRLIWVMVLVASTLNCQSQDVNLEKARLESVKDHPNPRMRLQLIASRVSDFGVQLAKIKPHLNGFTEEKYDSLYSLIMEKDIPDLQSSIISGKLTYSDIVLFYWYRIAKYESDPVTALHSIISLNENALQDAIEKDQLFQNNPSLAQGLFGMPLLLKDNINTEELPTTAGANFLRTNKVKDATISKKLKEAGAILLGKANLSEWAYYFCSGCPVGYSAVGGQTINPYGPLQFESGGSSSGSGVAIAANYAVAAIGSETSGSILSPSSQNSIVGLKPTVGSISRARIIPISRSLDTAGPMTKSVIDNLIIYNALIGSDSLDGFSFAAKPINPSALQIGLKGKRIAFFEALQADSLYKDMLSFFVEEGAILVSIDKAPPSLDGFLNLLNGEMKEDLPTYFKQFGAEIYRDLGIPEIIQHNNTDLEKLAPYGQQLFEGILKDDTSREELNQIRDRLMSASKSYIDNQLKENQCDMIVSINNYHAGVAALAHAPCLTIPMGYKATGEPSNITLITKGRDEFKLFEAGLHMDTKIRQRKVPKLYK